MMNILGYIKKNTVIKVILIIEAVLILLYVGLICIRGTCNYTFEADSWQVQGDLEEHEDIERTENSSNLTVYSEEPQDSITVLTTENFKLYPGSYRIKIDYLSQVNYDEGASFYNSTGSLSLKSEKNSVYFSFPDLKLRDGRESVQQTVQITSPYVISDVSLSVQYTGQGELAVYSIQVEEILAYRFVIFFAIILSFVLLDVACYYLFFNTDFRRKKEMGVLILICFGAALPFLAGWNFDGHDYSFHMNRILCLSEEIANGNFFPAIFSTALNDYGYANPLFYGQLFLYIPALLYNGGVSLSVAYNIYIILVSIATCLITYYCALKIFKRSTSALFASALYTLSAVRLTNILTREAVGEYTAQTFLPLVILGFYYIYTAPKGRKI